MYEKSLLIQAWFLNFSPVFLPAIPFRTPHFPIFFGVYGALQLQCTLLFYIFYFEYHFVEWENLFKLWPIGEFLRANNNVICNQANCTPSCHRASGLVSQLIPSHPLARHPFHFSFYSSGIGSHSPRCSSSTNLWEMNADFFWIFHIILQFEGCPN